MSGTEHMVLEMECDSSPHSLSPRSPSPRSPSPHSLSPHSVTPVSDPDAALPGVVVPAACAGAASAPPYVGSDEDSDERVGVFDYVSAAPSKHHRTNVSSAPRGETTLKYDVSGAGTRKYHVSGDETLKYDVAEDETLKYDISEDGTLKYDISEDGTLKYVSGDRTTKYNVFGDGTLEYNVSRGGTQQYSMSGEGTGLTSLSPSMSRAAQEREDSCPAAAWCSNRSGDIELQPARWSEQRLDSTPPWLNEPVERDRLLPQGAESTSSDVGALDEGAMADADNNPVRRSIVALRRRDGYGTFERRQCSADTDELYDEHAPCDPSSGEGCLWAGGAEGGRACEGERSVDGAQRRASLRLYGNDVRDGSCDDGMEDRLVSATSRLHTAINHTYAADHNTDHAAERAMDEGEDERGGADPAIQDKLARLDAEHGAGALEPTARAGNVVYLNDYQMFNGGGYVRSLDAAAAAFYGRACGGEQQCSAEEMRRALRRRRKKERDEAAVRRSEDHPGYRGDRPLDELLAFIDAQGAGGQSKGGAEGGRDRGIAGDVGQAVDKGRKKNKKKALDAEADSKESWSSTADEAEPSGPAATNGWVRDGGGVENAPSRAGGGAMTSLVQLSKTDSDGAESVALSLPDFSLSDGDVDLSVRASDREFTTVHKRKRVKAQVPAAAGRDGVRQGIERRQYAYASKKDSRALGGRSLCDGQLGSRPPVWDGWPPVWDGRPPVWESRGLHQVSGEGAAATARLAEGQTASRLSEAPAPSLTGATELTASGPVSHWGSGLMPRSGSGPVPPSDSGGPVPPIGSESCARIVGEVDDSDASTLGPASFPGLRRNSTGNGAAGLHDVAQCAKDGVQLAAREYAVSYAAMAATASMRDKLRSTGDNNARGRSERRHSFDADSLPTTKLVDVTSDDLGRRDCPAMLNVTASVGGSAREISSGFKDETMASSATGLNLNGANVASDKIARNLSGLVLDCDRGVVPSKFDIARVTLRQSAEVLAKNASPLHGCCRSGKPVASEPVVFLDVSRKRLDQISRTMAISFGFDAECCDAPARVVVGDRDDSGAAGEHPSFALSGAACAVACETIGSEPPGCLRMHAAAQSCSAECTQCVKCRVAGGGLCVADSVTDLVLDPNGCSPALPAVTAPDTTFQSSVDQALSPELCRPDSYPRAVSPALTRGLSSSVGAFGSPGGPGHSRPIALVSGTSSTCQGARTPVGVVPPLPHCDRSRMAHDGGAKHETIDAAALCAEAGDSLGRCEREGSRAEAWAGAGERVQLWAGGRVESGTGGGAESPAGLEGCERTGPRVERRRGKSFGKTLGVMRTGKFDLVAAQAFLFKGYEEARM